MAGRYIEPPNLMPDPALIDLYLRRAMPIHDEVGALFEGERIAAVQALVVIYREQVKEGPIDPRLRVFFDMVSQSIWMAADPIEAITEFLQGKPKRGAKPKTAERDFFIAVDVEQSVIAGKTVDDACALVSQEVNLSFDRVRMIYFDQQRTDPIAIRAELSLREEKKTDSGRH
jgi:hypothetical protein